jgi:hypothetical protein
MADSKDGFKAYSFDGDREADEEEIVQGESSAARVLGDEIQSTPGKAQHGGRRCQCA